jgi:hypothetical protein
VIYYGIVNEEAWKRVEKFRIGNRAQSRNSVEEAKRKGKTEKESGGG